MAFESLPGFREFFPERCALRNHVFGIWRRTARACGFAEYDAPVLEPLELYIEKSGEEIVGQLFNFEDRGGRQVALRPEMTPSLARMVGEKANSLKRPVRWFNVGEHYRYERPQKGRLRAFYQFNADILGEPGPGADAELVALAVSVLRGFGLGPDDFRVRLSDRDLWMLLLGAEGVDATAAPAVLGVIDKMGRTSREAVLEKLGPLFGGGADSFLGRVEEAAALRDLADLREFVGALPLEGGLREQADERLARWEELLAALEALGAAEFVHIDLGIVRGLAYYTGFVFEAFEASGQSRALAGGGRYDALVRKLGGPDFPATGFAMGDVTLLDLLEEKGLLPPYIDRPDFVAVIGGPDERPAALRDCAALRARGLRAEYPFKAQAFGKQFKEANRSGARFALIYGTEEVAQGKVKLRDLGTGGEALMSATDLLERLPDLLEDGLPGGE